MPALYIDDDYKNEVGEDPIGSRHLSKPFMLITFHKFMSSNNFMLSHKHIPESRNVQKKMKGGK